MKMNIMTNCRVTTFLVLLLCLQGAYAQHTITGHLAPKADFKWIIAYELTPTAQRYVADAKVIEGDFLLTMPANAVPGIYRLVYGVPQDEFYVDVLYSGKEDLEFDFSWENGISFTASKENNVYNAYLQAMAHVDAKILDFYRNNLTDASRFLTWIQQKDSLQNSYESRAEGLMAATLIEAGTPYLPQAYEPFGEYMANSKAHFYEHVPMEEPLVQASGFLTDKVIAHTFTTMAPPPNPLKSAPDALMANVDDAAQRLKATPVALQTHLFHELWKVAQRSEQFGLADYIFNTYLSQMALTAGNKALLEEIGAITRLRVGQRAPEIEWEEQGLKKSLSAMDASETYLLVFWSSTCSHCLQEVPLLYDVLQDHPEVQVLAIGLEDNLENWQRTIAQFPNFEHAISLDKWESEYAKTYAIQKTPTYFLLDDDKHILAKPDTYGELLQLLGEKGPK